MSEPLGPNEAVSIEEITISNKHVLYWTVSRAKRKYVY